MLAIEEYVKPKSAGEAYILLTSGQNAAVIGGGVFTRLSSRKIGVAIDLSQAGLNFIQETDTAVEIGAMTTFRELEKSAVLQQNLGGLIPRTVCNVPGVQLRNMVTVGGTIYGRYGFSELLTSLMVVDTHVVLHHHGTMSLIEFLTQGNIKDILEKVVISKQNIRASYQMFRNSSGSLPILCAAVSKSGNGYKIAVGGRPGAAVLATQAMDYLGKANSMNEETPRIAAEIAEQELGFGNDRKASAAYRRELCKVLVKRAVMEVGQ